MRSTPETIYCESTRLSRKRQPASITFSKVITRSRYLSSPAGHRVLFPFSLSLSQTCAPRSFFSLLGPVSARRHNETTTVWIVLRVLFHFKYLVRMYRCTFQIFLAGSRWRGTGWCLRWYSSCREFPLALTSRASRRQTCEDSSTWFAIIPVSSNLPGGFFFFASDRRRAVSN